MSRSDFTNPSRIDPSFLQNDKLYNNGPARATVYPTMQKSQTENKIQVSAHVDNPVVFRTIVMDPSGTCLWNLITSKSGSTIHPLEPICLQPENQQIQWLDANPSNSWHFFFFFFLECELFPFFFFFFFFSWTVFLLADFQSTRDCPLGKIYSGII